ncbi:MAG: phage tail tip lysozyme [Ruminococcus sp.]
MALKGKNNEEKIWNFLIGKGLSTHGAAGLMGNLNAESALNPMNLQNTYEKSLGFTDATYTAAVDSGKYTNFVHDCAGYGLAQWTHYTRKEALLHYAKSVSASIGDLETQLGFLYKELSSGYASLLATLKSAASVRAASDAVLTIYERPADMSERVKVLRASFGQTYFDRYAGTLAPTAPEQPSTSLKYKAGDVVNFTGSAHYVSSSAANGTSCKPGKVKITAVYASGKHPYHAIAEAGGGSTAYGWVDADKLSPITEIKIGDAVKFKGGPHYASSNAAADAGSPKAGPATVTTIAKGAKHPYHVVHTDKQSTVYGWVDAALVEKTQ